MILRELTFVKGRTRSHLRSIVRKIMTDERFLDPIMVLVPLLFYCSPLGVTPIRGVINICDNHKGEEQENKHW